MCVEERHQYLFSDIFHLFIRKAAHLNFDVIFCCKKRDLFIHFVTLAIHNDHGILRRLVHSQIVQVLEERRQSDFWLFS